VPLDEVGDVVEDDNSAAEHVERWKEHEALQAALTTLPHRRSNILLLYEDGYTTAEIADHLSIREELVRKEKSLGLKQLRQQVAIAG
jgi:RNA polymerase sigma factor (sigma-70 family)